MIKIIKRIIDHYDRKVDVAHYTTLYGHWRLLVSALIEYCSTQSAFVLLLFSGTVDIFQFVSAKHMTYAEAVEICLGFGLSIGVGVMVGF